MTLTKKTDHVTEAQNNLITLFQNKLKFLAFIKALVSEVQELENAGWDLYLDILDTAVGVNLDVYGAIVGEDRENRADVDYRSAIRARILLNLCNGTPEDIINLMVAVADGGVVQLTEYFPAAFTVFILKAISISVALRLNSALQSGKAAGVKAHLVYSESEIGDLFQFDLGPGYDQGKWAGLLDETAELFLIRSRDLTYLKSRSGDTLLIAR